MGRKATELGALAVSRIKKPGLHFVGGVDGLALQVIASGARTWILRASVGGKRRDMGLGGYPDVTLAGARDAARRAREKIRSGVDPIEEARIARLALAAERAKAVDFRACGTAYIKAMEAQWTNAKHAKQWTSTLEAYAYPVLGPLPVQSIDQAHVLRTLEPIWYDKTETATRLRGRIESILDWAIARGYRAGENPARWRGHLDKLLPMPTKLKKVAHHAALPYQLMADFMDRLLALDGQGARALVFVVYTAARSGEVRGMTWAEVDLDAKTWVVPAERMKSKKGHKVPLSDQAVRVLKAHGIGSPDDFVFPNASDGPLSDMTLTAVLRRMKLTQKITVHGFRSTFRDWASECTDYPREVCELALAHTIGDKVEAAYRRGDLFRKRQELMQDWADYCSSRTAGPR